MMSGRVLFFVMLESVDIPYLSINSNVMVTTRDRNKVGTDLIWWRTFTLLYSKARINFVVGLGSWLGRYHEYGSVLYTFYTPYFSRNSNVMITTTKPNLG
jgi:hypothetical protein